MVARQKAEKFTYPYKRCNDTPVVNPSDDFSRCLALSLCPSEPHKFYTYGSAYRCNVSQVVTGEGERDEKQRKLDHECSSPSIPITDKSAQRTSETHANLHYGVRSHLYARDNVRTPVNMLETLWASPRDC